MNAPLWMDLREGGAGTWQPNLEPVDTSLRSLMLATIVLLIGAVLFFDALIAGQAWMCESHRDAAGKPVLSYCETTP